MIDIKEKENCCGCSACVQVCPKQCISMSADNEGFLYPHVDMSICIDCGLCQKVCPIIDQYEPVLPLSVYAAKNTNDGIRLRSSSGGIFTLLAEQVISEGGVVFGARFDAEWNVIHDYTETIDGLESFRGSKYVQSFIGDNYTVAKQFLNDRRRVLFSGTPCQISGLKKFLRKEYMNLLTVEVVCHGVPSPMVWRDYLDYKCAKYAAGINSVSASLSELPKITSISFRDKTYGWKTYCVKICYSTSYTAENTILEPLNTPNCEITPFNEDLFMKGFLKDLYIRPSCYHCASRQGKSGADISIADYWGVQSIHPEFDDNRGVTLILINTEFGAKYYNSIANQIKDTISSYEKAIIHNPCIVKSAVEPSIRQQFWQSYSVSKIDSIEVVCELMTPPHIIVLVKRIIRKIKSMIKR